MTPGEQAVIDAARDLVAEARHYEVPMDGNLQRLAQAVEALLGPVAPRASRERRASLRRDLAQIGGPDWRVLEQNLPPAFSDPG